MNTPFDLSDLLQDFSGRVPLFLLSDVVSIFAHSTAPTHFRTALPRNGR